MIKPLLNPDSKKNIAINKAILDALWAVPEDHLPISKQYLKNCGFSENEISNFCTIFPNVSGEFFNPENQDNKDPNKAHTAHRAAVLIGTNLPNPADIHLTLRTNDWTVQQIANQWEEILAIAADHFAETKIPKGEAI